MAIITGTPWDLALNQRAHRAPIDAAPGAHPPRSQTTASSAPAETVRLRAGSTRPSEGTARASEGTARSSESPGAGALSARAAYQQALHRRARIVDIRTAAERDRYGLVHAVPEPAEIRQAELVAWLVEHASNIPIALLSQDGAEAAAISRALTDVSLPSALYVQGGFLAWERAGLPVRSR